MENKPAKTPRTSLDREAWIKGAIAILADQGVVWLLTPKPGRDGHVESSDISDAAPTAGLQATSTISAASDWQGTRLVAPRVSRR